MNIAIDGPSGAGKSTIAKKIAKQKNIVYLDTGAMYRAAGLKCLDLGKNPQSEKDAEDIVTKLSITIKYDNGEQKIYLDGKDVSQKIRQHHISKAASDISKHPCIRLALVDLQRQIAKGCDAILDGRDIGTYVLPNAEYKFFLTATPQERATRRYLELKNKGQEQSFEDVLKDINTRDKNDSERDFAPLKKADDAIEIDSTNMSIDEVADYIMQYIK